MSAAADAPTSEALRLRRLRARSPEYTERNRKRMGARSRALEALARAHPEEFSALYEAELDALEEKSMTTFNPGDKVTARYGALLDDDGEPMVATVLHESTHPGDDGVLIRYRCTDGSATDNWVKTGDLERAGD